MVHEIKPFSLDPKSVKGISEKILVSHYENNYAGAVKRLNAIAAVVALDMYEHAYHMDYGARAGGYVDAFMEAINWDNAVKLYDRVSREG